MRSPAPAGRPDQHGTVGSDRIDLDPANDVSAATDDRLPGAILDVRRS